MLSSIDWEAMQSQPRWAMAALGSALAIVLGGCGTPGAPQPPSLNLPERVTDLSAMRAGNQVSLTWSMPKRSTDKLIMKGQVAVRVCRREGAGSCNDAGSLTLAPSADGSWSETLPPSLTEGAARELSYFVELKNHAGKSAGLSDAAVVLAGQPPAPIVGLRIEMHKQGAVLHWTPNDESAAVRLQRRLLTPPAAKPKENLTAPPQEAVEQSLLIEDARQGQALDKSIRFGETYEYRVQRVSRVTVDGKQLELSGEWSAPVRVEAIDVFPPAVPTGLVAVAVRSENGGPAAIDLSWEPDAEADVAGYIVYRHEEAGSWQRISPSEPVVGPAFRDAQVQAGHSYHYAVSAIDLGGHESARSAEIEQAARSQ
jgi:hypothetical protein